jgi:hypothetical protein
MTVGHGVVAGAIVLAAIIMRWQRHRRRHWSVHFSVESKTSSDEGPGGGG